MTGEIKKTVIFFILGYFLAISWTSSADEFPSIESLMSSEEYHSSGLHRLSESEREQLNQWLIKFTANEAPILRKTVSTVRQERVKSVESSIVGGFSGWNGKSVFNLANGQRWQQRNDSVWRTARENPEVVISRNFFGFYEMKIVGTSRSVGVKRIK